MLQDELKLKEQTLTDASYRSFTSIRSDAGGETCGEQLSVYVDTEQSASCDGST